MSVSALSVEAGLFDKIGKALGTEIPVPNLIHGLGTKAPIWLLLTTIVVFTAIIYAGLHFLPFIKDQQKPRAWLAIGLSVLIVFTTNILTSLIDLLGDAVMIGTIALFVAAGFLGWSWISAGTHKAGIQGLEQGKEKIGAEKELLQARKEKEDEKGEAETQAILKHALNALAENYPEPKRKHIQKTMGEVGAIDSILTKIGSTTASRKAKEVDSYLRDAIDALKSPADIKKCNGKLKRAVRALRRLLRAEERWARRKMIK